MHVLGQGCNRAGKTCLDPWNESGLLERNHPIGSVCGNPAIVGPAPIRRGTQNAMRLTCPNCGARYEVDDALIPPEGRDVQCSDCATTWFQAGARRPASEPPAPRPPFPPSPDAGIDEAEAFAGSAVPDPAMAAEAEVERHGKPEPEAVSEPGPEPEPGPSMDEPEPEPVRYDEPGPEPEPEPHVEGPEITPVPEPGDLTATMVEARDEAPDDASDETLTEIPQSAESAMRVVAENDEPDAEASDKDEPHVEDEDAADTTPGTAGRRGSIPMCATSCAPRPNGKPACARRPILSKPRPRCRWTKPRRMPSAPAKGPSSPMPRMRLP